MKTKLLHGLIIGLSITCTSGSFAQNDGKKSQVDPVDHQLSGTHFPVAVNLQTEEESLLQDLSLVAKSKGWTIAEAKADYDAAEVIGEVAAKFAALNPEQFVGSVLSPEPGGAPTLYVKGTAKRSVQDLVRSAKIFIHIKDEQPFSFAELEQREMEVHRSLANRGFSDIATWFDFQKGGDIFAAVTSKAGLPKTSIELERALPDSLKGSVRFTISDEPVAEDFYAYGGMAVTDGGVRECTAGWSVQNSWGTRGVTTAGHCTGIDGITHPGIGNHSMTHQAQHRGAWGDVEWKTTVATEAARFYATASSVRNVTSLEPRFGISVGESICFYGRSSNNRDCSLDVSATSVSCTVSGVSNNRLVRMNGNSAIGGDSGGGWSFNYRAYGSVKGICGGGSVFSVADLYDEALGVTVRTQ